MAELKVVNQTRGTEVATHVREARTFSRRLVGWMGKGHVRTGEGLRIIPCNGVHTFFMRVPIDVLILDEKVRVLKVISKLKPWRVTALFAKGKSVLELAAGAAESSGTREGDILRFL